MHACAQMLHCGLCIYGHYHYLTPIAYNPSVWCAVLCMMRCATVELSAAPSLEALLKEATEAYRAGDYNRALALCQPVGAWQAVRQQRQRGSSCNPQQCLQRRQAGSSRSCGSSCAATASA